MITTERPIGSSRPNPHPGDRPGFAGTLVRAARHRVSWFPRVLLATSPQLTAGVTFANAQRLRLVALTLLVTQPVLIVLDWVLGDATPTGYLPVPWANLAIIGFRAALAIISLLLLLSFAKVSSPAQVRPYQHWLLLGYSLACLVLAALWTVMRWPVTLTVYTLSIFAGAAMLAFPWRQSLLLHSIAWLFLMVALTYPHNLEWMNLLNIGQGTLFTALAFILSRITYAGVVRQYRSELLIEQQRRELASANQRLAEANATLERLSFFDALTEVPNRRYLDEYLRREWRRAQRERTSLALLMLDIDCFKQFNDSYGHQAGDECLRRVAQAVGTVLNRPADLFARYGGDEFVAVLPSTDLAGANLVAERIHEAVSTLGIHNSGSPRGVLSVSLGVAARLPASGESLVDLLAAADDALRRVKAADRNRGVVAVQLAPKPHEPLSGSRAGGGVAQQLPIG